MGQTPLLLHQARWTKLSAISGVTPRGRLYFSVHNGAIRDKQAVAFLTHLLRHIKRRPIMLIWDRGQPHRSALVKKFLKEHPRLEVRFLPGYSPELNPDEWVWAQLKDHELAGYAPLDTKELKRGVRLAVVRMRRRPDILRSFIHASDLPG